MGGQILLPKAASNFDMVCSLLLTLPQSSYFIKFHRVSNQLNIRCQNLYTALVSDVYWSSL